MLGCLCWRRSSTRESLRAIFILMTMKFDEYWAALAAAGWIEARSESRVTVFRKRLEVVWSVCPADTVNELGFGVADHEDFHRRDFLGPVLQAYADAAEGRFSPTDAATEFPGRERVLLSFTHQGRRFSREAPYLSGEIEPAIDSLCNEALAATQTPYRFFPVAHADLYAVVLVRPLAYEAIKRRGWLDIRPLPGGRWGAILEGFDDPVERVLAYAGATGAQQDKPATVLSLAGSGDSVLREWVAEALSAVSGEGADEALLLLLCDPDRHVREQARRSLRGRFTDDGWEPTWWVSRLRVMADDPFRAPGAVAALGDLATGDALNRAAEALVDSQQSVRDAARAALAASGADWASSAAVRAAVPLVLERLKTSRDRPVRLASIEVLRFSRDSRAIPVLLSVALDDGLGGRPEEVLDEIDKEWPKHEAARASLAHLQQQALNNPDEKMRAVANKLAGRIQGLAEDHPGVAILVRFLAPEDPSVRMFALMGLQAARDPSAIPAIELLRDDPDPEVRRMAREVLAALRPSEGP